MGWSRIDNNNFIGDTSTDVIYLLLNEEIHRVGKISFSSLLKGIKLVLNKELADYIENGQNLLINSILAQIGNYTYKYEDGDPELEFIDALEEAIKKIVIEYDQVFDRKPRLKEILGTFAFVLSADSQVYLHDNEVTSIKVEYIWRSLF